ncbi:MAG: ABC transporter substrate-binding protein, partial [Lachnospiraceae bacterium]
MKKRLLAIIVTVTLAVSSLAGCGTAKTQGDTVQVATSDEIVEVADEFGQALKLSVTTGDGSTTDDKIPTPWLNRIMATNLMFRALFLADSSLTNPQPDLAQSCEISEDSLVYTITMKDGLKWSDGEALTAEDVKWSIETALQAATCNSIYTSVFKNISEITVEGNSITLTLEAPYASMMDVLAQFAILPKHCLENADPLKLEAD